MPCYRANHRPGDITTLGLLFEGSNYKEWKAKMAVLLRYQGYEGFLEGSPSNMTIADVPDACKLLRAHVSPSMWSRCPASSPAVKPLLGVDYVAKSLEYDEHLKALTQPFRLLDLPAEIRNSIYTIVLRRRPASGIVVLGKRLLLKPWLPMLHASSQMRREALPLFYAITTFQIRRPFPYGRPYDPATARKEFNKWLSEIVRDNTKDVRHIQIALRFPRRPQIDLAYSKTKGLSMSLFQHCSADDTKRAQAKEHVADIDKACKITGVKNQSIAIALAGSPILWEYATFSR